MHRHIPFIAAAEAVALRALIFLQCTVICSVRTDVLCSCPAFYSHESVLVSHCVRSRVVVKRLQGHVM